MHTKKYYALLWNFKLISSQNECVSKWRNFRQMPFIKSQVIHFGLIEKHLEWMMEIIVRFINILVFHSSHNYFEAFTQSLFVCYCFGIFEFTRFCVCVSNESFFNYWHSLWLWKLIPRQIGRAMKQHKTKSLLLWINRNQPKTMAI